MKRIEDILIATGKVPEMSIRSVRAKVGNDDEALRDHFISNGAVTDKDLYKGLAKVSRLGYVELRGRELSADLLSLLPSAFCRAEKLIPIEVQGETLFVATPDPDNFRAMDEISASIMYNVIPVVATPGEVQEALNLYFRSDQEIDKLSEEIEQVGEEEEELDDLGDTDTESPVVRFVNLLIAQAIQDRASDIHVEPGEKQLIVRYRIDGVMHKMQRAEKGIQNGVVSRLKIMSDIDIGERRKPQDGRMSVRHNNKTIDIRVVTLPTSWGEKVVMRILDHNDEKRSISSIGMSERNESTFKKHITKPHGMILVTGPTGSGKSTTIYTALDEVSNETVNVVTVEDPVEKKIPGISQMQINNRAGMTFSNALRSILRADPDIVFLGEIRDEETAKIAVDASMTGHLVLSTLHTNGAPEAAARLSEMGVEPYLVASSVTCVVAQRLARRLCNECKVSFEPEVEALKKAGFPYHNVQLYKPVGCSLCANTGYKGRVALTEVLEITEEIEPAIISQRTAGEIRKIAEAKNGFISLKADGWEKVAAGVTTVEEILRVAA